MQTTLDILVAARALIAKPENWCRDHFWQPFGADLAYCIRGALIYGVDDTGETALPALDAALPLDWRPDWCAANRVHDFNNQRTHAEILAVFDRAITAERQKLGVDDRIAVQVQVQALLTSALTPTQAPAPEPVL